MNKPTNFLIVFAIIGYIVLSVWMIVDGESYCKFTLYSTTLRNVPAMCIKYIME